MHVPVARVVSMTLRPLLAAAAVFGLSASARAGIIFDLGNNPQADEENVLFTDFTGNPIFGVTNQSGIDVRFGSTSEASLIASGGQARVESGDTDGTISNLTLDIPNGFFTDLILNPFNGSGTANITVKVIGESDATFSYALGNGQNFLTILAINGEQIQSVTIDAASGFTDLRQPRISGASSSATVNEIPEPSTMLLALIGITSIGLNGLRRRSAIPSA